MYCNAFHTCLATPSSMTRSATCLCCTMHSSLRWAHVCEQLGVNHMHIAALRSSLDPRGQQWGTPHSHPRPRASQEPLHHGRVQQRTRLCQPPSPTSWKHLLSKPLRSLKGKAWGGMGAWMQQGRLRRSWTLRSCLKQVPWRRHSRRHSRQQDPGIWRTRSRCTRTP